MVHQTIDPIFFDYDSFFFWCFSPPVLLWPCESTCAWIFLELCGTFCCLLSTGWNINTLPFILQTFDGGSWGAWLLCFGAAGLLQPAFNTWSVTQREDGHDNEYDYGCILKGVELNLIKPAWRSYVYMIACTISQMSVIFTFTQAESVLVCLWNLMSYCRLEDALEDIEDALNPHHYSTVGHMLISFQYLSIISPSKVVGSRFYMVSWLLVWSCFLKFFASLHQHNLGFIVGFAMTFIKFKWGQFPLSGWPCWPSSLCQTPAGMRLGDGHSINSILILQFMSILCWYYIYLHIFDSCLVTYWNPIRMYWINPSHGDAMWNPSRLHEALMPWRSCCIVSVFYPSTASRIGWWKRTVRTWK